MDTLSVIIELEKAKEEVMKKGNRNIFEASEKISELIKDLIEGINHVQN
jgi:hypothetical protein